MSTALSRSAMAAIAKFARLPFSEKLLILRALAVVAAVKTGLITVGFAAVRRVTSAQAKPSLDRSGKPAAVPNPTPRENRHPSPDTIAQAVEAASLRIPGGRNCLVRALATEYLLHRYCYPCELRIGAKRGQAGEFTAHAWLESGGRVLIGDFELKSYVPLTPASPSDA